jgi:tetratricopeptide (TPR) repeat protein
VVDKGYRPAWLALGVLLEASGDLASAQRAYEQAAALAPADADAQLRIGTLANRRGLPEQAVGLLLAARQAGNQSDQLLYHLGLAQAKTNHWDEAIEAWGVLSERHPQDEALRRGLADCRQARGRQRFNEGDYAGAIQDWEACLGSTKAQAGLRKALGEAAFRQAAGCLQQAAADPAGLVAAYAALEKACVHGKGGEDRLVWLESLLHLVEGDFQAAAGQLEKLLLAAPADMRLAYHLGFALFRGGQASQAAPYLEQTLGAALPPAQQQAICLMLADHSAALDQWVEAAQLYRMGFEMQGERVAG